MSLTITDLPFEMLENVASHLHRNSDLLNLSLTCKTLQYPCTMQMFRAVDIYFFVDINRQLDTSAAEAMFPALMAIAPGSTSGRTNGSFVKSLCIGLGTIDEVLAAAESEEEDPIYYYFRRRQPAKRTIAAASCFLHWVADLFCACPNLSTLRMDVPHFAERLFRLTQDAMGDVSSAAAGLQALRNFSCSDSNLGFRAKGHAVWHHTLLIHRFADLASLSLEFESMSADALLFWESSLTRPVNLVHLELQWEDVAYADRQRMAQVAYRAIAGSPRLQTLSLRGQGGSGSFPLTPDVMAALASQPRCENLHLTSIGDARLNQVALELFAEPPI